MRQAHDTSSRPNREPAPKATVGTRVRRAQTPPVRAATPAPTPASYPRDAVAPIALVGIGCRFPGAIGPDAFWQLLREGRDAIREVPPDRFDVDAFYDPRPGTPGKIATRYGGFLDNIDHFDASFFGIAPREAARMDPQQRLLLEVAWEALENGGQVLARYRPDETGVFVGALSTEYEDLLFDTPENVNVYSLVGSSRSVLAGRLSYALGVEGPSVTVDTACSSSLVALHLACQALRAGECRLALVGGVNLILEPKYSIGFSQARMLAPDGRCKAFDARANGFVRSDGVAVVALKPLDTALAAGDPIYAVIRGSAVNNDGRSGGLLMTPSQQGQEAVLRAAYRAAGVMPGQVQYVEAHGTGTSAGDPIEAQALGAILAEGRAPGARCAIGSVKTNIGHTEGAAGLAGVIKVALALQRRQLPPSLHCDEPNPAIPWGTLPLTVQRELAPWPAHEGPALAGVNSFGISGTNAHVIIEEAPATAMVPRDAAPTADPVTAMLLPLSAHSPEALVSVIGAMRDWLGNPASAESGLRDLCHTASLRRAQLDERLAVVAATRAGLIEALDAAARDEIRPGVVTGRQASDHRRKIAFVFPGQGGQWAGMARDLLAREPVFRAALTACDAALRRYCDWSLLEEIVADAAASRLDEIDVVQPALFAVQVALAAQWRAWGITPEAVVGHSMGEVAAAHVAGILSLDDAARIICLRSQLLRRTSGRGAMVLVALSWDDTERALAGYADRVAVAASNSPTLTVLSGDPEALAAIMAALQQQGVFCQLVRVDVASHSPQMDPLRPELLRLLDGIHPQSGHTTFASTVTLARCQGPELDAAYWVRNLREPVRLAAAMQQLVAEGYDTFVELSPHPTLISAVQQMLQPLRGAGRALPSLRRQEDGRAVLLESLGTLYTVGCPIAWDALNPDGRAVALPTYPWQHERFWFDDDAGGVATPRQRGVPRLGSGGMPLLGQHLVVAGEPGTHLWEMELGIANLTYLTDHRVQGKAVLPGAAYVELALEAAAQAFGPGTHALEAVRFHQALVLPERGGVMLQMMLSAPTADRANVQIFSQLAETGDAGVGGAVWTRHASATLRIALPTAAGSPPDADDPARLRARCAEPVAPAAHYAALAARELNYGPAFQGVSELWRGPGEALAQVRSTEAIAERAGTYILHPALLDACFQTLVAALGSAADDDEQATETYLPVAIEFLRVHDAAVAEHIAWCHAVRREDALSQAGASAPESITGDLRVLDAAGRVLVEVVALRAQRLAPEAARAEAARVEDWLYQVAWQESPPAESAPVSTDAPGTWLFFADHLGVAAVLRQRLEAHGETCILVARNQPSAESDVRDAGHAAVRLDPTDPAAYGALLRQLVAGGLPPLRGAVHLWSLDAPEPHADDLHRLQAAQDRGSVSLLYLAQALAGAEYEDHTTPRLWVVTTGAQAVPGAEGSETGNDDALQTLGQTPILGLARVIPYELPELRCARVDLSAAPTTEEVAALAAALWSGDSEDEVALRGTARYVRRVVPYQLPEASEPDTAGDGMEIVLPATAPLGVESARPGMLDQLALRLVERQPPGPGEVEVQVRAAGLNFIDLMRAMGIYPDQPAGAIPLGIECAGVVVAVGAGVEEVRVGDAVVAITPASESCLRTYVTTKACLTFPKPEGLSFAQTAVQPMAYLTAWYALHHLGHMAAGERVLIHAAAGGVGLAALALAQRAGAEVYATVGSAEKRAYLAARGVQHIMDSRSLDFADEVLAQTGGAGVDLVLNSLSGAAIPRSLATLGAYGRFLELGKSDIYQDRQLGLGVFRNNISFAAIDVDRLIRERPEFVGSLLRAIAVALADGSLAPLPERTFALGEVADAFRYMAQSRQIGKIAVNFDEGTAALTPSVAAPAPLRADATYLITGGLGGLGLVIARWMVEHGVRHLVLTGRGAASAEAARTLDLLRATGAEIAVEAADVARPADVARVLARIAAAMPPLHGVIHAAGVLDDGILLQQNRARFQTAFAPKVAGAWNLHTQTRHLPLDYFILFSSAAAILGSPGQGNYVAANTFLDALAHQRRVRGLPALSIDWGAWTKVGLAARPDRGGRLALRGVGSFSPAEGITALSRLLTTAAAGAAQVAVMPFSAATWRRYYPVAGSAPFLSALEATRAATGVEHGVSSADAQLWEALRAVEPGERQPLLADHLAAQLARVLGLTSARLDRHRPFTQLGLDSLMAVELKNHLDATLGVNVRLIDLLGPTSVTQLAAQILEQLDVQPAPAAPAEQPAGSPDAVTPDAAEAEAAASDALATALADGADTDEMIEQPALLSYGQRALWFLHRLAPDSAAYNVAFACELSPPLDTAALRRTFARLVARHASLRTTYEAPEGEPVARVHPDLAPDLREEDARAWSEAALHARLVEEAHQPFDLARGPLLRVRLFGRLGGATVLSMTAHHIALDFWSLVLLMEELRALYEAERAGTPTLLPAPDGGTSYAALARWQRDLLDSPRGAALWDYWQRQLDGAPTALDLPTDHPRPMAQTYVGRSHAFVIPRPLTGALKQLARAASSTLYTVLLAAFQTLLARYSGQEDLLVGTSTAGRSRAEFEGIVGYFVNPVVMRANLAGDPSFTTFLGRVRQTVLEALEHQDYPFPLLVERLHPHRDASRSPLFQTMFLLEKPHRHAELAQLVLGEAGPRVQWGELAIQPLALDKRVAQFDLTLMLVETDAGLSASLEGNADLFEAATLARMAGHYQTLLAGVAEDPQQSVWQLPLLTPAERHEQAVGWNATAVDYPRDLCVHELIAAQAARTPDAIAVTCGEQHLTYAELEREATQLAHALRERGVGPETLVGLCLERSVDMVVALLGVLKAGGAYVPLSPSDPTERLAYVLADADAALVLTHASLRGSLPEGAARVLVLDETRDAIAQQPETPLAVAMRPDQLAYVLYTSGSTGRPKGVMIEHAALTNFLWAMRDTLQPGPDDTLLAVTTLSFDIAGLELYLPLLVGARTVIASREMAVDGPRLIAELAHSGATLMQATPATWRLLLDARWQGDARLTILCGGEALSADLARALATRGRALWNLYGPTETTIWSSAARVTLPLAGERVGLGRPLANTQFYVLDAHRQPVPVGVPGELYIGGSGLARGYLGRPDLTAERFPPHPFDPTPGARVYRTGDVVRWRPDGTLEYLSRGDDQIKLRGFRIELGEIETVLCQHPAIQEAVVAARTVMPDDQRLVAYLVARDGAGPLDGSALRAYARASLPDYMVPVAWLWLPSLPLTPNRKVDRRALPAPRELRELRELDVAASDSAVPRTPTEEAVATIWRDVLGVKRIDRDDDFFALGGHSLLATRVMAQALAALHVDLPLRALFEAPTLAGFAARLDDARQAESSPRDQAIPVVPRDARLPLSWAQERLWFLDALEPGTPLYSIPAALELRGPLDAAALSEALRQLVARHEVLRTRFASDADGPRQVIDPPPARFDLSTADYSALGAPLRGELVGRAVREEAMAPFDLARGPLLRARLLRLASEQHLLLLTLHHIVFDGWSVAVFLRDLAALYRAARGREPAALPPLPIQFADVAAWQHDQAGQELWQRQLDYWRVQLAGAPARLDLPTDHPAPSAPSGRGAHFGFALPLDLMAAVERLARQENATPFMTLLAAFDVLLARLCGQDEVVVGTPIAGRTYPATQQLIGCFVNLLALRADLAGDPSFRAVLRRVRQTCLDAYSQQEVPFERIVQALQPERRLGQTPIFQVLFTLDHEPRAALAFDGLELRPLALESGVAKYDLTLALTQAQEGLRGEIEYSTDRFNAPTVARLAASYETLLSAALADPDHPIATLPLLAPAEASQLAAWNASEPSYPEHLCLHQLFEAQVARTPEAVAVVAEEGGQLTYAQLDQRANQLARELRAAGVGPETLVGLCLERSLDMVVAVLAVHKAGGAYVPLDPALPPTRLAYLLADSQTQFVVTTERARAVLPPFAGRVIALDHDAARIGRRSPRPLPGAGRPDALAYVIYTSGTTGQPKGVLVEHRTACHRLLWAQQTDPLTADDAVLQLASLSFDVAVLELFRPLIAGARVVLPRPGAQQDTAELVQLMAEQRVTLLDLVPSLLRVLLDEPGLAACAALRQITCGGEALPGALAARVFERLGHLGVALYNRYGPTEATIDVTYHRCEPDETGPSVPIGRHIADAQLFVLDARRQPVPIGVSGELYIGEIGRAVLARGYLGRPDLTTERFVPHPFDPAPDARLYRTGDLVRWRADGELEYLGRTDRQVKLHGYRIELEEIEAALGEHFAVREAAVALRPDGRGDPALVAYVALRAGAVASAMPDALRGIRDALRQRLPGYMVPAVLVDLAALPRLPGGKLDWARLPEPEWARLAVESAMPVEQELGMRPSVQSGAADQSLAGQVAAIWAEVLGLERVDHGADFFALGGYSLLAARLVLHLRAHFGVALPLRVLFEAPTVAGMARALAVALHTAAAPGAAEPEAAPAEDAGAPVDWSAETALDPHIQPSLGLSGARLEHASVNTLRHIFLTGATGFVGAFLLAELLRRTPARISCLVRAASRSQARDRLRQTLVAYELWDGIGEATFARRVEVVTGDLAAPRLGLSPRRFASLAREAEVIYHSGAEVNFVAPYAELRAANVLGTQEVLRLACAAGATPVHYVSTLSVFPPPSGNASVTVYEDDALTGAGDSVAGGYAQSKWAAEQLVRQAQARGLPVSIYRLGLVTGDSQSGAWQPGDALSRAIKACIQLEAIPDLEVPLDMTPVDYVTQALVALSLGSAAPGATYHLANPYAVSLHPLLGSLHAAGYAVLRMPYAQWRQGLVAAVEDLEENALAPLIPLVLDTADPADLVFGTQQVDDRHVRAGLAGTSIACPVVNEDLLGRSLAYWKRHGFLPTGPATPKPAHPLADGPVQLRDVARRVGGTAHGAGNAQPGRKLPHHSSRPPADSLSRAESRARSAPSSRRP